MSYHVTSLIRLSLVACVCRSNLGNKRTRFTHSLHRMAHTLRHFCSCSSIGTDTRCCSNGAGFLFDITYCRWIAAVGAGSASPKPRSVHLDHLGEISKSMQRCLTYVRHDTASGYASRSNPLNDGTVKNRVKARFCSGVSEEMFKVR